MTGADKAGILFVLGNSRFGGTSTVVLELFKGIDKDRFDLYAALPDGDMLMEFKRHAKEVLVLPGVDTPSFSSINLLRGFIKSRSIKVVHTHLPGADILGGGAAWICGVPAVSTVHALYYAKGGVRKKIFSLIYRAAYLFHKKVIAVSYAVKEDLINRVGLKIPSDKITVIYNGIEKPVNLLNPVEIKGILGIRDEELVVGMVGRMDRLKGFHVFLDAIPIILVQFPIARFIFVGDGNERKNLEIQAENAGIADRVVFTGYKPNIYNYLQIMDVVVLSSFSEGCPISIIEAMAVGKPVVASAIPAIAEVVKDGMTGFLFPIGNSDKLASHVVRLLKDSELRKKTGGAGESLYKGRFSAQKMVSGYETVYKELSQR